MMVELFLHISEEELHEIENCKTLLGVASDFHQGIFLFLFAFKHIRILNYKWNNSEKLVASDLELTGTFP